MKDRLTFSNTDEADQPTWTIYLSGKRFPTHLDFEEWGFNLTTSPIVGVWHGQSERGLRIDMQATVLYVNQLLCNIAERFPDLRWVHVERRQPEVQYVDLQSWRQLLQAEIEASEMT